MKAKYKLMLSGVTSIFVCVFSEYGVILILIESKKPGNVNDLHWYEIHILTLDDSSYID